MPGQQLMATGRSMSESLNAARCCISQDFTDEGKQSQRCNQSGRQGLHMMNCREVQMQRAPGRMRCATLCCAWRTDSGFKSTGVLVHWAASPSRRDR